VFCQTNNTETSISEQFPGSTVT